MRPIKLTMTAFGPYRDSETIDFNRLEDKRIFIISGSTGAGKTSIFDAICYALYDSASGEDRAETRMLRSHYAEDDVHTAVNLAFAVGKRIYRVYRQMGHRKGSNKSETGEKAELYEIIGAQEVPIAERFLKKEVNEKIEAILGLTKEQFSQIVMLPQGEFRKLLTSDTDNKEEILRHIFRTQLYERLEARFQLKSKELKDLHRDAKSRLDLQLLQVRELLPKRQGASLWETYEQEFYSAVQVAEGLAGEEAYYMALSHSAHERRSAAAAALERQETMLREAIAVNEKFDGLEAKRVIRAQLELKQADMAQRERQLALAERAARIEPYVEHAQKAADELEQKRQQAELKQREADAVSQEFTRAEARHREELALEPERKALELELQRLSEMLPVVMTLEQQRSELDRMLAQQKVYRASAEKLDSSMQANRLAKQSIASRLKELEVSISALPGKLQIREQLRSQHKALKAFIQFEQQLRELEALEAVREQALILTRREHDQLERLWLEGQASLLAAHLHDGQPCPVCGSEQHPHKAEAGDDIPSRDALKQAKDRLRVLEQEFNETKGQSAAAKMNLTSSVTSAEDSGIRGLDGSNVPQFQQQLSRIEQEGKTISAEIQQIEHSQAALMLEREALEKLEVEHEESLKQKEQLSDDTQQIALEISKRLSVLEAELARIPEELRTPVQLERHIEGRRQHYERLMEAWVTAVDQLQKWTTRAAEERVNLEQLGVQQKEAELKNQEATERFMQELVKADFGSHDEYKAALMTESLRQSIGLEIDNYRQSMTLIIQQIDELEQQLGGRSRYDVATLQQELDKIKSEVEQIQSEQHTAERYKQESQRLRHAVIAASEHVREMESELEQVLDIYQTMKGDNVLKISFERYILLEFLEQILHAANVRLQQLSSGQFTLRRSERLELRGKQSGLGLDVYDAYTGQNRDVKSLSGGEKFNASLSLALGMTDVIQAHQGGVTIEMMFIDEGFGSLDEESLNKAIAALIDLQRAGRMIGVISHVRELKQAFPAVLEVQKTRAGYSRTEITIR